MKKLISFFAVTIFLSLFVLQTSALEAASWGQTEEISEYEGNFWNGVYFDLKGLYLTASIPNYTGASLQNSHVKIGGSAGENLGYAIITNINGDYKPEASLKKFIKNVENDNPGYIVSTVKDRKFGARYVVDLVPTDPENHLFLRFFCTKNRIIQMGTIDTDMNRRAYFFDSLHIR